MITVDTGVAVYYVKSRNNLKSVKIECDQDTISIDVFDKQPALLNRLATMPTATSADFVHCDVNNKQLVDYSFTSERGFAAALSDLQPEDHHHRLPPGSRRRRLGSYLSVKKRQVKTKLSNIVTKISGNQDYASDARY